MRDEIKSIVKFEQMNLIDNWPARPPFDVILLRNALGQRGEAGRFVDRIEVVPKPRRNCG